MKRFISILCLLVVVMIASSALAVTPIRGRVRVYGCKDEVRMPDNKFAPRVVYPYRQHEKNCYAEFHYIRENANERHWNLSLVDGEGNPCRAKSKVRVYLPYPSIWSEAEQTYWRWTQRYAEKHYIWEYALGYSTDVSDNGNNVVSNYLRGEYKPVVDMDEFGPYVEIDADVFEEGLSVWIKFDKR